jgi:hypothetical protein
MLLTLTVDGRYAPASVLSLFAGRSHNNFCSAGAALNHSEAAVHLASSAGEVPALPPWRMPLPVAFVI